MKYDGFYRERGTMEAQLASENLIRSRNLGDETGASYQDSQAMRSDCSVAVT